MRIDDMSRADFYMNQMIREILENGYKDINPRPHYADGTPAHTISVNHTFRKYDLSKGEFPICTLRPQAWKTGIKEIFTIYQKPTNNLEEMREMGVGWWDEWDIGDGTIGQRYGATVKRYDLINRLIDDIKNDPYGRRKIVSLWQETDLRETPGLAPCAFQTIWNVRNDNHKHLGRGEAYLDMMLVQRSGDMLTASGPGGINEIQYAALLMMVARHTGYKPGVFTHIVANEQIYDRHIDAAMEMKKRYKDEERKESDETLNINHLDARSMLILNENKTNFYDFTIEDFFMVNYNPIKPQLKLELGI
jgi:thymidylate synthase